MADERFVLIEARSAMAAEMLATTPEASIVAEERFVETVAASARTVERSTVVEARAEVPSTAIAEVVSETSVSADVQLLADIDNAESVDVLTALAPTLAKLPTDLKQEARRRYSARKAQLNGAA